MTYFTVKYIKGNPYLYEVRSEREGDKVRQVFVAYHGRFTGEYPELTEREPAVSRVEKRVVESPISKVTPPVPTEVVSTPKIEEPKLTGVKAVTELAKTGEITRDEYITRMLDENAFVQKGDKWYKPDASGVLQEATEWAESMQEEFGGTYDKIIAPSPPTEPVVEAPKEPWEMTREEYVQSLKGKPVEKYSYYNRQGAIQKSHKDSIIHALQLGKEVPENVLREFEANYPADYHQFVEIPKEYRTLSAPLTPPPTEPVVEVPKPETQLIDVINQAVKENPKRAEHYDTGEVGFWIVGDKYYTWRDWNKIPVSQRREAIPVHSHSGVHSVEQVKERGIEQDYQPLNAADIHQWLKGVKQGIQGNTQVILYSDGGMEILNITENTDPAILRLSKKQLEELLHRPYDERAKWYEENKDKSDYETYGQERELLREFADKYGLEYKENLKWEGLPEFQDLSPISPPTEPAVEAPPEVAPTPEAQKPAPEAELKKVSPTPPEEPNKEA